MNAWIGLYGLIAAVTVAAGWHCWQLWHAALRARTPLAFHRMLEQEGISLGRCVDITAFAQAGRAIRGCVLCNQQRNCALWLDGKNQSPLQTFCPNALTVQTLRAR